MAAATTTTLLLGSIILLAVRSATLCCLGFAPASHNHFTNHQRQHSEKLAILMNRRIVPSASESKSALFGLANVNDYFASFNANSDDDNDDSDPNDSADVDVSKKGKYIGHGRIDGGGNEGGLFDTNNYFSSFANDLNDGNEDYSDESQSTDYALTDKSSDEPSSQQFTNKQPMQRMTYEEIVAYNNARLCPKMLLTQRAIQSFIYLLEECRDPHSGKWLEDYLGLQNLGNYHGTGAINITQYPTWDNVLYSIMSQPNEKMIVSAKRRGRGHGGWSKNNPYLQERWVEFKIDIRPASLVQRLLPLRQQLAKEFRSDLGRRQLVLLLPKMS